VKTLSKELLKNQSFALGGTLFGWTLDRTESWEILDYFYFDLEQRVIDTADSYSQWKSGNQGGESETIIGDWIKSRRINRDEVFICTKIGKKLNRLGYSADNIDVAVKESLKRLNSEYIDLLYIHSLDNFFNVSESSKSLSRLMANEDVNLIGASNFDLQSAKDFSEKLMHFSGDRIFAIQNHYNLIERDSSILSFDDYSKRTNQGMATQLLPWMREFGIYNFCYHALCRGVLTNVAALSKGVNQNSLHAERTSKYFDKKVLALLDAIAFISEESGVSVSSIALSWLRQEYPFTIPVISTNSIDQLRESSKSIHLSDYEFDSLDILGSSGL
jgi:aryl-alcohol dehydrogenase-like predicted oxidoreductase